MVPSMRLSGQLVCKSFEELAIVRECLPQHVRLTRAEPGCVSFQVRQTSDPYVWQVDEEFIDSRAFEEHQRRVASSAWGRCTVDIERRYVIDDSGGSSGKPGRPQRAIAARR